MTHHLAAALRSWFGYEIDNYPPAVVGRLVLELLHDNPDGDTYDELHATKRTRKQEQ